MGWASGSELYREVIRAVQPRITCDAVRTVIHKELIVAFERHDWDTQGECEGIDPAFDAALAELHPDWGEDED